MLCFIYDRVRLWLFVTTLWRSVHCQFLDDSLLLSHSICCGAQIKVECSWRFEIFDAKENVPTPFCPAYVCVCVCASVALQWIEDNQQKSSLTLWHIKISVLWSQVPGLNFFYIISFFWWWSKTILISEMYISVKAEKSTSGHFCMCSGPDNDSSVGKRFDWTNRVHICNIATFSGEG